ncbi:MAG: tail fiber domain-containing protein, partial [Candidatus Thorarchaeota archaeon]
MPLSKLENLIKNTEGRILYVNPNDIDATDGIENQGNSLARPFKTIQRALIEAARFSYVKGNENDLINRTTILCFPGEHIIDNRPGFYIKNDSGTARSVSPAGTVSLAADTLSLSLQSVFDLGVEDNVLYKFNSVKGGIIIPRGTSIVGLDLRKTKIRPKYVPNPTDTNVSGTAIFRVTGGCYFNSFTFFDGNENSTVYTDPTDFGTGNRSRPLFSHHKVNCFEFADGVNIVDGYTLTDLDMYYAKLSNAFNTASGRDVDQKYPSIPEGFTSQRAEYEIVGAFAPDAIALSSLTSGDGVTAGAVVTVSTASEHGLTVGTPVKIRGVIPLEYNISTTVTSVINSTSFTYTLPKVPALLSGTGAIAGATVTVETDTVSGASPYVFNVSLRSVYGMNGIFGDGSTATGFKSIVLAQFTAISLQKDDRAFVKYNEVSRLYEGINLTRVTGSDLPEGSSSTSSGSVYHLDSRAVYREGWETAHILMTNDSIFQIVSVFAIGFNRHFAAESGADASITNSNSNFGQIALTSDGFKSNAFTKDDQGYITSIITPKAVLPTETDIEYLTLDVGLTTAVGVTSHLYLFGYNEKDVLPLNLTQGYRVGSRFEDKLYLKTVNSDIASARIEMVNTDMSVGSGNTVAFGDASSEKSYSVNSVIASELSLAGSSVDIQTGEKIRLISDDGDLPENIEENTIYFAIKTGATTYKVASTLSDALKNESLAIYGGTNLTFVSRVSDKVAGDLGHPLQFDESNSNWYLHTETNSGIYTTFLAQGVAGLGGAQSNVSFIKRIGDNRGLDDKVYKVRYFIPKETPDARDPREGFVLQQTANTGVRTDTDFTVTGITTTDYAFNRNPSFISSCTAAGGTVTVITNQDHKLFTGDTVVIKNATSTTNTVGAANSGFNGRFLVSGVTDSKTFTYSVTDTKGIVHLPGDLTNDINTRSGSLPRFERGDLQSNLYVFRSEVIQRYVPGSRDGIYHLYLLKADNAIDNEFTTKKFSSAVENFYPQLDKDNLNTNPRSAKSFAKRTPIGDVATDDLRKSITRETVDTFVNKLGLGNTITAINRSTVSGITTVTLEREHGFNGIV